MDACLYSSDLNDAEWALLAPVVCRSHPAGRRQTYPVRRMVDAIFYLLRTGAARRFCAGASFSLSTSPLTYSPL